MKSSFTLTSESYNTRQKVLVLRSMWTSKQLSFSCYFKKEKENSEIKKNVELITAIQKTKKRIFDHPTQALTSTSQGIEKDLTPDTIIGEADSPVRSAAVRQPLGTTTTALSSSSGYD